MPFLDHIQHLLADPAGRICVSAAHILAHVPADLLNGLLKAVAGEGPSALDHLRDLAGTLGGGGGQSGAANMELGTLAIGAAATAGRAAWLPIAAIHLAKTARHANRRRHLAKAAPGFVIARAAIGLKDSERAVLRGMAHLYAARKLSWEAWHAFYTQLAWAGGRAEIIPPPAWARSRHIDDARKLVDTICRHVYPDHEHFIQLAAARIGQHGNDPVLGPMIHSIIHAGARWLTPDDMATTATFKVKRTPAAVQIGALQPGRVPLYFDGNESLATIAGPGTGKTASQVIPNLLTYPGSCFVLDVKDELWPSTASYRAKHFGPVYRFAPTDPSGCSHRYNPLDFVPIEAAAAERECQIIANMIIPDNPSARDPFWEQKAREYLWALSMLVAFNANPGWRHLGSVTRLLSMQTNFPDPDDYLTSDTKPILDGLRELADRISIPALRYAADALNDTMANEKMLQAILDTCRARLNPITRSPTALAAMQESDWAPLDLRRRPGTTVYFCLKPDEIKAYAPIVRLVFQQHVSQLTRNFTPKKGEPPITFFLDELPQLGHMPNLSDIIDVGRGAGVRLWMFMQYLAQMRDAYGQKALGLIEACRVRSYMQPDTEAAKAIEPLLGEVRNIFSGERKPLAYSHELAGQEFRDDIIVVARGEHPARLAKLNYYEDPVLNARTKVPPPHVPSTATRPAVRNAAGSPIAGGQQQSPAAGAQPGGASTASAAAAPGVQRRSDPVIRPCHK